MLKGFKDFLMRGNVIDLAVAVVVGSAFTALVTAVTTSVIKPVIAAAGGANVRGLSFQIIDGNEASVIDFAVVINSVITFLITAAVVYFLFVMPMQKIQERRKKGKEEGPADPTDVELLQEIRDLLRRDQGLPAVKGLASDDETTVGANASVSAQSGNGGASKN
ncbi:large conductance mechanosensitive channel protein MscL [Saccharopolyspora sp. NPDC047091]|uniref:large conductance mechanosensitive channel protein MscL n=1 Tax=Saccharopolyspora sp. NPDC047091 TaxID=3155924 RepID=UPI0033EED771